MECLYNTGPLRELARVLWDTWVPTEGAGHCGGGPPHLYCKHRDVSYHSLRETSNIDSVTT